MATTGVRPRSLPTLWGRQLPPLPLAVVWLVMAMANAWFVGWTIVELLIAGAPGNDWAVLSRAAAHMAAGDSPYTEPQYLWSPVAAALLIGLTQLPFAVWALAHVLAAILMPTFQITVLLLVSWPFWQDLGTGNIMTFVLLAAAWALAGSRPGMWAFFVLAVLVPRPLTIPPVIWLLWRRPEARVPFAAIAVIHLVAVIASGLGTEWLAIVTGTAASDIANESQVGPSRWIGGWWFAIGVPLAGVLLWRGRVGLASLAAAPYWLPYYLMMALLEAVPRGRKQSGI